MSDRPTTMPRRRDLAVAAACGVCVALMVGLSYAAVPFYSWFCQTTGFGGRPVVATVAPAATLARTVTVRFDSNITGGLPWRFEPEQTKVDVQIGAVTTIYYTIQNLSARDTLGQAAYNVTPSTVGGYFNKINCFCFTEQALKPGEKREIAVVFFVDPALTKDSELDDLNSITLSYTFYPLPVPPQGVADGGGSGASGQL